MTQEHPLTPPGELVQQWVSQMITPEEENLALDFDWLANKAARWGADQELEACCEWLDDTDVDDSQEAAKELRAARRPKPRSLKEEALEALKHAEEGWRPVPADCEIIRRALESLPD